ncbi:MAG: hypothetical protein EBS49_09265 [Verrucomicrobia bacterium]|nr:hypothetical protein [Verrucomicrobiota bacterium]
MKFTFIGEHPKPDPINSMRHNHWWEDSAAKTTHEFECVEVGTVMREFKQFLLGCGFHIKGEIDEIDLYDEEKLSIGTETTDKLREGFREESEK